MATTTKIFRCVVVAPHGKLVDTAAQSAVIPAHDGKRGVMADHSPMFCELGLGIMEVETTDEITGLVQKEQVLVDGGFAVICENHLKVVSYDVIHPKQSDPETIDDLQRQLQKDLARDTLDPTTRRTSTQKLALLDRLLATV